MWSLHFCLRTVWLLKPFNETENIRGMLTVLQLYIPVFRIGFKFSIANHNIHFMTATFGL